MSFVYITVQSTELGLATGSRRQSLRPYSYIGRVKG